MAAHQEQYSLGSETPSRFVATSQSAAGLWSLGLKTGLTPQHLAPLSSGSHHKLEINPFEQSYANSGRRKSSLTDQPIPAAVAALKRPLINGLQINGAGPQESSSSNESRSSNESAPSRSDSYSQSAADTPPSDVGYSPQGLKSESMLASFDSMPKAASNGIDANAYAEHLARYVQAQQVHATRTSAPLAGHSTSRPLAPLANSSTSAPMTESAAQDSQMDEEESLAMDDSVNPDSLPPAMSAVQLPTLAPRIKKSSVGGKTSAKRPKVGRPRLIKEEEVEEPSAEESKRREFLERNRQAACKSRQKRKAWQANLEAEAHRLTESNGHLQSLVASLREEIASLRATVAGHAANGCQGARLALQAARPGDLPMAAYMMPSPSVASLNAYSPTLGHHPANEMIVGRGGSSLEGAMAFHHPSSAIEVQRSRSSSSTLHEMQQTALAAVGASYYDVSATTGLLAGRPTDVDLSACLA